jgi:protoporphyrinogen oxidase
MRPCYLVIGGGITGLAAAHDLAIRGLPVLLVESSQRLGGLLRVTTLKGSPNPVEEYYHTVFSGETNSLGLIDSLGLTDRLEWGQGISACLVGRDVHRVSTPLDLLRYRPLTLTERVRVGLLTLQMKRLRDLTRYDDTTAREFVTRHAGPHVYRNFFEPLLRAKFAGDADTVAASWLISRVSLRNDRGKRGERLGYLRGSFKTLIDALQEGITARGGTILLGSRVEAIEVRDGCVATVTVNGRRHDTSAVISTIPPRQLASVLNTPPDILQAYDLPYQGSVCVLVALDRSLTGVWWTNVMSGMRRFGAIVEHTTLPPVVHPGLHLHYLSSYPEASSPVFEMPSEQVFGEFFADLRDIFPGLSADNVLDYRVAVDRYSALIPRVGVVERVRANGVTTPIRNLFIAGIVNSYPERSMDASIARARECVAAAGPRA